MKPVAYFLCALALVLICISPWLILSYYEKLPEQPSFEGIITLWHISGWRTGGSSGAAFLKKRAAQFEAQNPHVFIDLVVLTSEQAAAGLEQGEHPDLISYPLGAEPELELVALPPVDTIISGLPDTAYPYMCGGYCLFLNTDLLSDNGMDVAAGDTIRPEALIEAAQYGVAYDAEEGRSALPAPVLHAYPPAQRPYKGTWGEPAPPDAALSMHGAWTDGFELFRSGEAAVLIASHRQLFEALESTSNIPGFSVYAIGPYTDMVQMIGVTAQEDALRVDTARRFAEFLLSEGVQKKLEALGVFPVISGLEIYRQDAIRRAVYEQLCPDAAVPDPTSKMELESLAKDALSGNADALTRLRNKLRSP